MGAKKRRQALRIPLSDSTNLTIPSTVLTLSTPFPVSRHANVFHAFNKDDPTSFSSPPPQSLNASSVHGIGTCEISETCSVYGRRKTTDKQNGKARSIAAPSSCPPAVKTQQTIRKRVNKDRDKGQSEASIAPSKKKQCRVDVSNHELPQDFIKQQRQYFAEIDAYKLEEEEVESGEQLE
ncbi:hypothetical protein I3843_02G174200 [Carya illinoinensis]|uniref:Uncharacterized protein n=1 Tax=Carya illinoinensis TaxID=32201 RepID=A0A8T1RH42_CARIL|nr:uncharacterized protein LOC122301553 [Carya illinoinensis]KAG6665965.1 hypothetical protein CIPAW_02G197600 [Carya illinoinensis]KAG7993336.1 hypothetical protein I3843_02G174200 [Carya illinoinensis]